MEFPIEKKDSNSSGLLGGYTARKSLNIQNHFPPPRAPPQSADPLRSRVREQQAKDQKPKYQRLKAKAKSQRPKYQIPETKIGWNCWIAEIGGESEGGEVVLDINAFSGCITPPRGPRSGNPSFLWWNSMFWVSRGQKYIW